MDTKGFKLPHKSPCCGFCLHCLLHSSSFYHMLLKKMLLQQQMMSVLLENHSSLNLSLYRSILLTSDTHTSGCHMLFFPCNYTGCVRFTFQLQLSQQETVIHLQL